VVSDPEGSVSAATRKPTESKVSGMSWTTAEVRWFYPGAAPERMAAWFTHVDAATEVEPPRVDHYLRVLETDGIGIKYREGRIEIKQRHASVPVTLIPRAIGLVELWRKWGFGLAAYAENGAVFEEDAEWISVEKRRWVRTYRPGPDGAIEVTQRSLLPQCECSVELTEVLVGDQAWWTLGFEASGEETTLKRSLEAVVCHVINHMPVHTFDLAHSYGYPRWLQLLRA
jgi:hypothetical protein